MYSARSTGSLELNDNDTAITKYPKLTEFEKTFRNPDDKEPLTSKVRRSVQKRIAECSAKKTVLGLFPIITTIKDYKVKEDLPNDIIGGLTSGVMMIPQGMAFAILSTLPPIVGLYISFFASITYFFLGTGRQLSWGCIAILSLMIASILDKYDQSVASVVPVVCINETASVVSDNSFTVSVGSQFNFDSNSSASAIFLHNSTSKDIVEVNQDKRMEVASAVTLVAGLILVVASRLGLSKITSLMSNSLITGFTVGISFHVATSQIKTMFGISIPRYKGIGSIIRTWIEVLKKLGDTNAATLIISVLCMLIIYLVKKFINERYKKKMRVPVPIELFVVIVATLISKFAKLHHEFDVSVVAEVPTGVPPPKLPDLTLATDYIGDALVIIVVAYAQTLAMAKTMGLKYNYEIDSNQEMLACGTCSVVCALFSGYITGASVSRSVVQDGAGGKTQVASLFAAGLVLLVIMVMGPYFYDLPMCVLSAIVVINLRTMFLKLLLIPSEWRKSRYDCAVWVFACVACIVLNAALGLLAGVVFSLLLIILRGMITPVVEAGQIPTSDLTVELRSLEKYSSAKKLGSVKIIKIKTPLYFVNSEIFTSKVISKSGINITKMKKKIAFDKEIKVEDGSEEKTHLNGNSNGDGLNNERMIIKDQDELELKVLILDAAEVAFIDLMGVQALQFLIDEFASVKVEVLITSAPENIIPMLESTGFWAKHGDRLFLTVEAALASVVTAVENDV